MQNVLQLTLAIVKPDVVKVPFVLQVRVLSRNYNETIKTSKTNNPCLGNSSQDIDVRILCGSEPCAQPV